jgi:hypothetical protein
MPHSLLDAIKSGIWNFEPAKVDAQHFPPTRALPGSEEKLAVLSERLQSGLPLWHPGDRLCHDESSDD